MTSPAPDPAPASHRAIAYGRVILAGALLLRVIVIVMMFQRCSLASLVQGHSEMLSVARSLAAGHGFASPFFVDSGPTAFLAPGYPLLIAGVFRLSGIGPAAIVLLVAMQVVFSTLTVWLAMRVARQYFGAWTANIAGCLLGFSIPLVIMPFLVWETCLSSLLLLAFIAALPHLRTHIRWAAAGAGAAIATLINPALFPAMAALGSWQAWRRKTIPWAGALVFLLLYAPWPARNVAALHAFIPFRSNLGYELWMGNHPGGDGNFNHQLDPEENPQERGRFVSMGELQYMRMKGAAARDFIRTHPAEFLKLTALRIARFWTADDRGTDLAGAVFSLLAFSGLALAWRSHPVARLFLVPLLIYPLPYYLTHADARFRHMIDPLLAILAAYAIMVVFERVAARLKSRHQQAQPAPVA